MAFYRDNDLYFTWIFIDKRLPITLITDSAGSSPHPAKLLRSAELSC